MPNGFIGQASRKYLTTVSNAMASANAVHNKNPFEGRSYSWIPTPVVSNCISYTTSHSPETAMHGSYITGVGNHTNVVVDQQVYDKIIQKIRQTDLETAETLYSIATQIEEMCESIYIVPATLPKYLEILNRVKSTLGEFQSLTEDVVTQTYSFVNDMYQIDGR